MIHTAGCIIIGDEVLGGKVTTNALDKSDWRMLSALSADR